jgi:hypothetical protein
MSHYDTYIAHRTEPMTTFSSHTCGVAIDAAWSTMLHRRGCTAPRAGLPADRRLADWEVRDLLERALAFFRESTRPFHTGSPGAKAGATRAGKDAAAAIDGIAAVLKQVFVAGEVRVRVIETPDCNAGSQDAQRQTVDAAESQEVQHKPPHTILYYRDPDDKPASVASLKPLNSSSTLWPYTHKPQCVWIQWESLIDLPTVALLSILPWSASLPSVVVSYEAAAMVCSGSSSFLETSTERMILSVPATTSWVVAVTMKENPQPLAVGLLPASWLGKLYNYQNKSKGQAQAGTQTNQIVSKDGVLRILTCYGDDLWREQSVNVNDAMVYRRHTSRARSELGGDCFDCGHYGNLGFKNGKSVYSLANSFVTCAGWFSAPEVDLSKHAVSLCVSHSSSDSDAGDNSVSRHDKDDKFGSSHSEIVSSNTATIAHDVVETPASTSEQSIPNSIRSSAELKAEAEEMETQMKAEKKDLKMQERYNAKAAQEKSKIFNKFTTVANTPANAVDNTAAIPNIANESPGMQSPLIHRSPILNGSLNKSISSFDTRGVKESVPKASPLLYGEEAFYKDTAVTANISINMSSKAASTDKPAPHAMTGLHLPWAPSTQLNESRLDLKVAPVSKDDATHDDVMENVRNNNDREEPVLAGCIDEKCNPKAAAPRSHCYTQTLISTFTDSVQNKPNSIARLEMNYAKPYVVVDHDDEDDNDEDEVYYSANEESVTSDDDNLGSTQDKSKASDIDAQQTYHKYRTMIGTMRLHVVPESLETLLGPSIRVVQEASVNKYSCGDKLLFTKDETMQLINQYLEREKMIDPRDCGRVSLSKELYDELRQANSKSGKRTKAWHKPKQSASGEAKITKHSTSRIVHKRTELIEKLWMLRQEPAYGVLTLPERIVLGYGLGRPPSITIKVCESATNKDQHETHVYGLSYFGIDEDDFLQDFRLRYGCWGHVDYSRDEDVPLVVLKGEWTKKLEGILLYWNTVERMITSESLDKTIYRFKLHRYLVQFDNGEIKKSKKVRKDKQVGQRM